MREIQMKEADEVPVTTIITTIWEDGGCQYNDIFSGINCTHGPPSMRSSFDSETTDTSSDLSLYYSSDEFDENSSSILQEECSSRLDDPIDQIILPTQDGDHDDTTNSGMNHVNGVQLVQVDHAKFPSVFDGGNLESLHRHEFNNVKQSAKLFELRKLNQTLQRALTLTKSRIKPIDHNISISRPREIICKDQYPNYELMLNLQLGIRYTIEKVASEPKRMVVSTDLASKSGRFRVNFPRDDSKITPPHQYSYNFKWKDYCPMVFRSLREMFKIDTDDYLHSICGNHGGLRKISSSGKSGSTFYLSHNDRFLIKTVRKTEAKVLLGMLRNYYEHVKMYPNTLLTKFLGLYEIKFVTGRKVRFVVMAYLFPTDEIHIHRKFDLKGSSQGRSINEREKLMMNENITLKDLDLDFVFRMECHQQETLLRQIEFDTKFLESEHIMDYSLLLGVHFQASTFPTPTRGKGDIIENVNADNELHVNNIVTQSGCNNRVVHEELLEQDTHLGIHMQAKAEPKLSPKVQDLVSDPQHACGKEIYDVVLYCGIIDILQRYDVSKRLEHAYKSLHFDSFSISAVNPSHYSKRFRDFIHLTFPYH